MKPAFVIRLCYGPRLEPEFQYRLGLFRDLTLPRLRAQTVPADVWVWIHPRHMQTVGMLGVHPFVVEGSPEVLSVLDRPWSAVRMPRYPVQILLGSDDLIGPYFVETGLAALEHMPERALVTFQPLKFDLANRRWYHFDRAYTEDRPSPFVVMRQPLDSAYSWVWARGHTRLDEVVDAVQVLPEGHCALTIHERNLSSEILAGDTPAEAPSWY